MSKSEKFPEWNVTFKYFFGCYGGDKGKLVYIPSWDRTTVKARTIKEAVYKAEKIKIGSWSILNMITKIEKLVKEEKK